MVAMHRSALRCAVLCAAGCCVAVLGWAVPSCPELQALPCGCAGAELCALPRAVLSSAPGVLGWLPAARHCLGRPRPIAPPALAPLATSHDPKPRLLPPLLTSAPSPPPAADVSNDVRRAAVMCLGFVLLGSPEQCPRIVALLAESYNAHVRWVLQVVVTWVLHVSEGTAGGAMLEYCLGAACRGAPG